MNAKRFIIPLVILVVSLWGSTALSQADYQPISTSLAGNCPPGLNAVILQNDSYIPGGLAGFSEGFLLGEMSASRFTPPGTGPVWIRSIVLLFGGSDMPETIYLHIWDDDEGYTTPGTQLYSGQFVLTTNDSALQEIDLISDYLLVDGTFRVGIEYTWNGFPTTGFDMDGIVQDVNFVYVGSMWYEASMMLIPGDWIIRAVVEPLDSPDQCVFLPVVTR